MADVTGKSTVEQIKAKNRETQQAIEDIDTSGVPTESEKDESPLAVMEREAAAEAARQEEAMHKKNVGVGGVNAGKL